MIIDREWLDKKGACKEGKEFFLAEGILDLRKGVLNLIKNERLDWANWLVTKVMSPTQNGFYAAYAAQQVIGVYEKLYPSDNRPKDAIKTAIKFINLSTEKERMSVEKAASAASAAASTAYSTAYAADYAANGMASTPTSGAHYGAARAAYAAAYAANVVAYRAVRVLNMATSASDYAAAYASDYAAAYASDYAAYAAYAADYAAAYAAYAADYAAYAADYADYAVTYTPGAAGKKMKTKIILHGLRILNAKEIK